MLTDRDSEGLTLIELVISVAILGIILGALTAAMLVALTGNSQTGQRLAESSDVQFAASYFGDDAEGAVTFATGTAQCGSDPAALEFRGRSFTTGNVAQVTAISYVLETVSTGGATSRELHRLACTGPSTAALAQTTDVILARELVGVGAPTCSAANGTSTPCTSTSAVTVRLTVTEEGFSFTLVGTRRTT